MMKKKVIQVYLKKDLLQKDGKEIEIPYRPDRGIDIGGLLEVFDRTDLGTPSWR
jgi:hypothetical protein